MTGRGAGFCAGFDEPGFASAPGGGGGRTAQRFGFFGRGRGNRNRFYARGRWASGYSRYGMSREEELEALKNQVKYMEEGLEETRNYLSELESKNEKGEK
jgi:hypothetical protein